MSWPGESTWAPGASPSRPFARVVGAAPSARRTTRSTPSARADASPGLRETTAAGAEAPPSSLAALPLAALAVPEVPDGLVVSPCPVGSGTLYVDWDDAPAPSVTVYGRRSSAWTAPPPA